MRKYEDFDIYYGDKLISNIFEIAEERLYISASISCIMLTIKYVNDNNELAIEKFNAHDLTFKLKPHIQKI